MANQYFDSQPTDRPTDRPVPRVAFRPSCSVTLGAPERLSAQGWAGNGLLSR